MCGVTLDVMCGQVARFSLAMTLASVCKVCL
jgi:hypothetical protein